jgi:hypothetical protein
VKINVGLWSLKDKKVQLGLEGVYGHIIFLLGFFISSYLHIFIYTSKIIEKVDLEVNKRRKDKRNLDAKPNPKKQLNPCEGKFSAFDLRD